jgi:hypothetical protein
MTLKLRATHLAPPAYAHLKAYAVLSDNWQIGSIWEARPQERLGSGSGVGVPFDTDMIKTNGYVRSLDEAKAQFQVAWGTWADLAERLSPVTYEKPRRSGAR